MYIDPTRSGIEPVTIKAARRGGGRVAGGVAKRQHVHELGNEKEKHLSAKHTEKSGNYWDPSHTHDHTTLIPY